MNRFCINLNLPISPLADNISINDISPLDNLTSWTLVDLNYINPKLKFLFETLGLNLKIAGLFTLAENESGGIHVDGNYISDLAKINWSYNSNHNMIWYKYKDGVVPQTRSLRDSELGSRPYIKCDPSDVEEIYRCPIGFPSLIQAGIPHVVHNYSGIRKCLSIILYDKNNVPVSMNRAKEIFSNFLAPPVGIEPTSNS